MFRSTIVGLVVVVLIAKAATSLRVVLPNSAERTEVSSFRSEHTKNFDVQAENGTVEIVGQDDAMAKVEITSVLQASAHDEESAAAALEAMEVTIEGKEQETCRVGWKWKSPRHDDWSGSVNFKILAPERVNVTCEAQNGAITVNNLSGTAKLKSQNGKIVSDTSGEALEARADNGVIEAKYSGPHLQLHTQNGTIAADLSHAAAIDGDITTHNGTVNLTVGDHTSCKLVASTVNGRVSTPSQKQSWIKRWRKPRSIEETLGSGGGTLKVSVKNGAIKVRHAKGEDDADSDEDESDD
jgi:hypothetical protein